MILHLNYSIVTIFGHNQLIIVMMKISKERPKFYKKTFDDDSKRSHFVKRILCNECSLDRRIQRIQELETYLEKYDDNKVISNIVSYFY